MCVFEGNLLLNGSPYARGQSTIPPNAHTHTIQCAHTRPLGSPVICRLTHTHNRISIWSMKIDTPRSAFTSHGPTFHTHTLILTHKHVCTHMHGIIVLLGRFKWMGGAFSWMTVCEERNTSGQIWSHEKFCMNLNTQGSTWIGFLWVLANKFIRKWIKKITPPLNLTLISTGFHVMSKCSKFSNLVPLEISTNSNKCQRCIWMSVDFIQIKL